MRIAEQRQHRKIHTRHIEISTYESDEENIVVEGKLKEDYLIHTHTSEGKRKPRTVHHMIIRMHIECSSLTIKEIGIDMPGIPYDECLNTSQIIEKIKGMKIAPGFTSKVRKLSGGKKGCLHLTTLILAMAPAIMQGYWVFRTGKSSNNSISTGMMEEYLFDTCWVWRKDGPLATRLTNN